MKTKAILFLFLLPMLALACNGSAWILVPAVVGDGSSLVNLSVRLMPGSSDVYLSTFPQTGTSTQISVEDSAIYAFQKTNTIGCDAIVKIDTSGHAGYVDGPSAGAALTVLTYSAVEGIEPRRDAIITGSVDALGDVGLVGGLYEKAIAATANGADYFIIPESSFLDLLLLRNVKEKHGLDILEAVHADELIDFMLYNKSLPEATFERTPEKVPDLPQYDTTGLEGFENVTIRMIDVMSRAVEKLPETDNESIDIKKFFRTRAGQQNSIFRKGYLFTAANNAFLDYIEVSTISAVFSEEADLQEKKEGIQECIQDLPQIPKTTDNFEWVVGSDLRRAWAMNRLNSTDISEPTLMEEKYFAYNDLMYADAWCIVSESLGNEAAASGKRMDESVWKEMAREKIEEALELEDILPPNEEHLYSAQLSYSEGKYGAALFDAVYALEMDNADRYMYGMSSKELENETRAMLAENRSSLWGAVYQAQAAYLANVSAFGSAFGLLRYATALDNATAQMKAVAMPPEKEEEDDSQSIVILSIFLIITMLLFYISMRMSRDTGRSHGRFTRTKRRRKVS